MCSYNKVNGDWACTTNVDFFGILEQISKSHYLGEFELLVMLTIIRLGENAYGVPISKEIEEQTGRSVAFGTVYTTLERLQSRLAV